MFVGDVQYKADVHNHVSYMHFLIIVVLSSCANQIIVVPLRRVSLTGVRQ